MTFRVSHRPGYAALPILLDRAGAVSLNEFFAWDSQEPRLGFTQDHTILNRSVALWRRVLTFHIITPCLSPTLTAKKPRDPVGAICIIASTRGSPAWNKTLPLRLVAGADLWSSYAAKTLPEIGGRCAALCPVWTHHRRRYQPNLLFHVLLCLGRSGRGPGGVCQACRGDRTHPCLSGFQLPRGQGPAAPQFQASRVLRRGRRCVFSAFAPVLWRDANEAPR